jgi:transposase
MTPIFAQGNTRTRAKLKQWQQESQTDKAPRVALRLHSIRLSLDGYTAPEIARLLDVDRTCVYDWICAWNDYQLDGLKEGHRCGRPSGLTQAQKTQLTDIVESGPVAYGLITGVWTSPLLSQVIAEEFGIHYHPGHVRKLLHTLGCSVQRPTTRLVQADPVAQNKWVRYTYPNLKKSPGRRGLNCL